MALSFFVQNDVAQPGGAGRTAGFRSALRVFFPNGAPVPPTIDPGTTTLATGTVDNDGGTILSGTVTGLAPGLYTVHIGPSGDISDPRAYSAQSGRGFSVEIDDNGLFILADPPLHIGSGYFLTYVDSDGIAVTSQPVLEVVARNYHTKRYDFARLFPPRWRTGPRGVLNETFPQL